MRLALTILALALLTGCGGSKLVVVTPPPLPPPVIAPEPPIPDWVLTDYPDVRQVWIGKAVFYVSGSISLDDVRKYVGSALTDTQKLRPAAKLEGIFVVKEMPNDCPRSSGPAFFADGVMDPREITGMRQWYPLSFVDGRPCIHGYFGSQSIPPVIYAPARLPEVIGHEALHAIWWANWVGKTCGGNPVWTVVEHGGVCDPFSGEK